MVGYDPYVSLDMNIDSVNLIDAVSERIWKDKIVY